MLTNVSIYHGKVVSVYCSAIVENVSFEELCKKRLVDLKVNCTGHHWDEYVKLFEKLKKEWEGKEIIDRSDVKEFVYMVGESSVSMANKYLVFIRATFNWGKYEGLVNYNPADNIRKIPGEVSERYVPPHEDVMAILNRASKRQRQFLEVLVHTLARVNENYNLKWEDVHENYLVLKTRKSMNSDLVPRKIRFNGRLKEVIESISRQGEYVFMSKRTGAKYRDRKGLIPSLCRKTGVKKFTFHCLRHYGAHKYYYSGVPVMQIQKLLGHSNASTTDLYLKSLGCFDDSNPTKALDY